MWKIVLQLEEIQLGFPQAVWKTQSNRHSAPGLSSAQPLLLVASVEDSDFLSCFSRDQRAWVGLRKAWTVGGRASCYLGDVTCRHSHTILHIPRPPSSCR